MWHTFWSFLSQSSATITALTYILQTVIIFVAAILALKQIQQAVRARSLDGFRAISQEMNSEDARAARAFIYSNNINPTDLSASDRATIERVCVTFDFIGVLVLHDLVLRDIALSMFFDVILRTWNRVQPFVEFERHRRHNDLYMMYYQRLAEICQKYHKRHFANQPLNFYFPMHSPTYRDFLNNVLNAASAIAVQNFGKVSGVAKAGDSNQVLTATDLEIGHLLVSEIRKHYPDHNVIDEETGVIKNNSAYTWVVDPIDGTSNFAAGLPHFGIMVGLLHFGLPIAGGIALPAFGLVCIAEKGQGAWCGNDRLAVSTIAELQDSLIAYGIDSKPDSPDETKEECSFLAELVSRIRNLRSSNSAFDAVMVAQGKYGAFLNRTSKIWDNVAPQIIIEEAGGLYTSFDGKPIDYSDPTSQASQNFTYCAAPPSLHRQLQTIVAHHFGGVAQQDSI